MPERPGSGPIYEFQGEHMPIYEYHCDACDSVFEEWHRHADDIMEVACPECKKTAHRLISNTTFVLKGGGWYVTEYGNRQKDSSTGAATASSPSGAEAKTESAPAAASAPAPAASAPAPVAAAS